MAAMSHQIFAGASLITAVLLIAACSRPAPPPTPIEAPELELESTATAAPTETPKRSPTPSPTPTLTATPLYTATPTLTPMASPTAPATPTGTPEASPTAPATPTPNPTVTPVASATPAATETPLPTPSATPIPYYAQFEDAEGIVIKSGAAVDSAALETAREIIVEMLSGDQEVRARLVTAGAAVSIIPRDAFVTTLPEFSQLSGRLDRNGNPYDSYTIRGLGAVPGQPVTATSEENLLGLPGDPFRAESVLHHEFAHAINNLGFDPTMRAKWFEIYENAVQEGRFPGTFAMTHPDEYFAELSQSFFSVNNEIGGPAAVLDEDPAAYEFLQAIYVQ